MSVRSNKFRRPATCSCTHAVRRYMQLRLEGHQALRIARWHQLRDTGARTSMLDQSSWEWVECSLVFSHLPLAHRAPLFTLGSLPIGRLGLRKPRPTAATHSASSDTERT